MTLANALTQTGDTVKNICLTVQDSIVSSLNNFEKECSFIKDSWTRSANNGGGISAVIENGHVFEKAGVNISAIRGTITTEKELSMFAQLFKQQNLKVDKIADSNYFATGISLVIHPINPYVPTVHMNYRYFEINTPDNTSLWWFGGGTDLTPYSIDIVAFKHFHTTLKTTCDQFDSNFYPLFKKKCDAYFYLPHRNEHRGIGGIFFDYLNKEPKDYYVNFLQTCADSFIPSYVPLIEKSYNQPFSEDDKQWQAYRRGRYVEFNLLHDRGTLFGLKTNGRIESIFMSLPRHVSWLYDETKLLDKHKEFMALIKSPKAWI